MPDGSTDSAGQLLSLASFDELSRTAVVNSPRSLKACKSEGVLPEELLYRPIEDFHERNLSPRLVKLRYDFFEAKRRDLLAASRRARDALLAEEKREHASKNQQLELIARDSGYSKGAILALNGDTLRQERQKLLRAQENERNWLRNALNNELRGLQRLENNNKAAEEDSNAEQRKIEEAARRMKEMNDRRQQEEERKAMEMEARQKLERQIAKEEFHKQQADLKKKGEMEAQRQKQAYERQLAEMERKRKAEIDKQEKREQAARDMEARKNEMRAQDLRRQDVLEQKQKMFVQAMHERKEQRDMRIYTSIQNNLQIEEKKRSDLEKKQQHDMLRDERLAQQRAEDQEMAAKRSIQQMMRRKLIAEEAAQLAEERRQAIVEHQDSVEQRLLEHEQKKERYLDFKRELDGLRAKNKEINVERQRRKEEAQRENVAEEVLKKDQKIEALRGERQRLHGLRRAAEFEAYRAREHVKGEIMKQRVASKFDSKALKKKLGDIMSHELFSPSILDHSMSAPTLKPQIGLGPSASTDSA